MNAANANDEGDVDRVYDLACSLVRPVARGYLSKAIADASILMAALKTNCGRLDAINVARFGCRLLRQRLHVLNGARDLATDQIRRAIRPMIARRVARNILLRAAHDVNGANGFPLSEPEVNAIVVEDVWWALPKGARHAS